MLVRELITRIINSTDILDDEICVLDCRSSDSYEIEEIGFDREGYIVLCIQGE